MIIFTSGIGGINQLLSYANMYASSVSREANAIMQQQGYVLNGMDVYNSLYTLSSSALGDARNVLAQVNQNNPDIPAYQPFSFNPPKNMGQSINDAMAQVRYVQERKAADPNWKGEPTEKAKREERMLELTEQQTAVMNQLSQNIETLNANTQGLPDWLRSMTSSLTNIQDVLLRMEQSLAAQAEEATEDPAEIEEPAE